MMKRIARLMQFVAVVMVLLPATARAADDEQQIREGTVMDARHGRFQMAGDEISFVPDDGTASMRCLQNLTLERVAEQLPGTGRERTWVVTGTVTEYQGRNYLLVTLAILKSRPTP